MVNLRETCDFSLETQGLYSLAKVHNMFCPGRMGDSAGSKVTQQLMGAETFFLEIGAHYDVTVMITVHFNSAE